MFLSITILLAILAVLIVLQIWSARQFRRSINRQVQALRTLPSDGQVVDPPGLIRDLAARSHRGDSEQGQSQDCPTIIRIYQTGEMRLSEQGRWLPFTAIQDFAVRQPGFVWRATFRLAPLIKIAVVDSYVNGKGTLEGRLLGSIPLLKVAGASTDKGELMRYLAELAFFPAALLNNPALHWRELNEFTIEVTCGEETAVRFNFDPNGDLVNISAPNRPRMVAGQEIETPWVGTFSDYGWLGGYSMPTSGEVSWQLEEGPFTYWRGRVTRVEYDPGEAPILVATGKVATELSGRLEVQ